MSDFENEAEVGRTDVAGQADTWIDDWVDAVARRDDGAEAQNKRRGVQLLWGFVGTPDDEDHVRLYLDLQAQYCVDVPRDEILHREPLPQTLSAFGGSILWITDEGWRRSRYRSPYCT